MGNYFFTNAPQFVTVQTSGGYEISAIGAQGGTDGGAKGGYGAAYAGFFYLTAGERLQIIVGGTGATGAGGGGGGGGSFVSADNGTGAMILLVAGGGGGAYAANGDEFPGGPASFSGGSGSGNGGRGVAGGGGTGVKSGGGSGGFGVSGQGGGGFGAYNGGAGGAGGGGAMGGFGGGGGSSGQNSNGVGPTLYGGGGGGGGYTGGNGGGGGFSSTGGTSFDSAGAPSSDASGKAANQLHSGNGFVNITRVQTTPPIVTINGGGPIGQSSETIQGTVNTTTDPQAIGTTVTVQDGSTSVGTGTVSSTLGSWVAPLNLSLGDHLLTASDTDTGGASGTSRGVLFTLFTTVSSGAETITNLSGSATFSVGATTLTVNEGSAGLFSGTIQDGVYGTGGNLVVAGAAPLTLTGVEAYTGRTSVSGTLALAGSGSIQSSVKAALTTAGATLDISGETTGTVIQKLGGIGGTIADLGSKNLKIKVKTGTVDTYAGTINDGGIDGGTGGSVTLGGLGELSLTAADSYTGGTTLDAGTLDLDALGAAGTGTITFANPAGNGVATLEIDAAALTSTGANTYNFANAIAGATSTNQVIDLTSLANVQGSTSATVVNGTKLIVSDGGSSVKLHLASASSKSSFTTASDGHGGTLVYDPPPTTPSTPDAKIDRSWIEAAMADFGGFADEAHAHHAIHDPHDLAASGDLESHIVERHRFKG